VTASEFVNLDQEQAWDRGEGVQWAEHPDRFDAAVACHNRRMLEAAEFTATDRSLDIGCGCGASTIDAARAAPDGFAIGNDLSGPMLRIAQTRARVAGVDNVRFERADAQVHAFDSGLDVVISRFGAMFFADPIAAFTNIGRAMRPDGRVVLLAWQDLEHNEWLLEQRAALAMGRELPRPQLGAPGPFGLADPDGVRRILGDSGFERVEFDVIEEPVSLGHDAADALYFMSEIGPSRGMLEGLSESDQAGALDNLRKSMVAHETPEGVLFGSRAWLITARRA
jgi:SAM-dependent methyltransferase